MLNKIKDNLQKEHNKTENKITSVKKVEIEQKLSDLNINLEKIKQINNISDLNKLPEEIILFEKQDKKKKRKIIRRDNAKIINVK